MPWILPANSTCCSNHASDAFVATKQMWSHVALKRLTTQCLHNPVLTWQVGNISVPVPAICWKQNQLIKPECLSCIVCTLGNYNRNCMANTEAATTHLEITFWKVVFGLTGRTTSYPSLDVCVRLMKLHFDRHVNLRRLPAVIGLRSPMGAGFKPM